MVSDILSCGSPLSLQVSGNVGWFTTSAPAEHRHPNKCNQKGLCVSGASWNWVSVAWDHFAQYQAYSGVWRSTTTGAHNHAWTDKIFWRWYASNVVSTVWRRHFPIPAWMHKARSLNTRFDWFGVEKLFWPARHLDLAPNKHLRDELQCQRRARHASSWPHWSAFARTSTNFHRHTRNPHTEEFYQKIGGCYCWRSELGPP